MASSLTPQQIDKKWAEYQYHGWGQEWALITATLVTEMRRLSMGDKYEADKHALRVEDLLKV